MVSESSNLRVHPNQVSPVELPDLLECAESKGVPGFDTVELGSSAAVASQPPPAMESEAAGTAVTKPRRQCEKPQSYAISIGMPASPSGLYFGHVKSLAIGGGDDEYSGYGTTTVADGKLPDQTPAPCAVTVQEVMKPVLFYSQPMPGAKMAPETTRCESMRDTRFDSFKTWSGRLERQLSNLRGRPHGLDLEANNDPCILEAEAVPGVDRYFDALEGPELDTLRATEVSVLPEDKKWPFLLRFPVNTFGMCLGVSSQAILWKTLATSSSMSFLHVSLTVNLVLWFVSLALMATVSFIYLLKVIFYFEAVRREYYHPVRVNFFFAPWIACLFLAIGVPPSVAVNLRPAVWYVLMAPIFCLELKIYGQWMSGGERRLSKVANPSNHLSIVGNFVGALLGASMGLKEGPIFFFAVGLAHYIVLFVTLYQRLPTNAKLPKELHPVFFLFVAAPSVACLAWAKIRGDFDNGSRIAYFIALFLYVSLAVRVNFFRGIRFSLAWWAYTFPMTGASVATIRYSMEVTNPVTQALSVGLSAIATFTVTALLITTIVHAFILGDLFPNDVSIAITQKKPKFRKFLSQLRSASSDMKDMEDSVSSKGSPGDLNV